MGPGRAGVLDSVLALLCTIPHTMHTSCTLFAILRTYAARWLPQQPRCVECECALEWTFARSPRC